MRDISDGIGHIEYDVGENIEYDDRDAIIIKLISSTIIVMRS